jgi:predicted nucleic acid-binding protein
VIVAVDASVLVAHLDEREVVLGSDVATQLALLRAQAGLKLPDCCVLLAARDAPAQSVATFDERHAKVVRGLGLQVR